MRRTGGRDGLLLGWLLLVPAGCRLSAQLPPATPDLAIRRFQHGRLAMQSGQFDQAVTDFQQVVRWRPDLVEARADLGLAYEALGEYSLAARELRRAALQKPDLLPAHLFLGISYLRLGAPDKALPPLEQALKLDPANAEARRALAAAELAGGRYGEAARQFRALFRANPDQADAWFMLGRDYLQLAKPAILTLSTRFRESAWSYRLAGDVLGERHLWNDAAAAYRKALAADPEQPGLREALGAALAQAGEPAAGRREPLPKGPAKSGEPVTSNATTIAPSRHACDRREERPCAVFLQTLKQPSPRDRLRLGQALLAMHEYEAASDAFAAALVASPDNPEALYGLSRSYLQLADECFDRLAATYPDSWRAHELLAETLHLRQADKEAIREYQAAERLRPDNPEVHEALGEILLHQHLTEQARVELEWALRLNPSAPRSLYLMGSLYASQRQPAKSIPYLEAALRYDPTLIEARPVLGKAYLKVGKPGLAAQQLELSASMDRYGDLHYLLYEAYRQEGKTELAAQALARSQALRTKSAADDQAKIRAADER